MSYAETVLRRTARRLLITQLLLVLITATAYFIAKGLGGSVAALYGGAIALLNTLISANRLRRASDVAARSANRGMMEMYIGAIMRFIATPLFVALGIAALGLDPIAIIVGFAVAQLGYFRVGAHSTKNSS